MNSFSSQCESFWAKIFGPQILRNNASLDQTLFFFVQLTQLAQAKPNSQSCSSLFFIHIYYKIYIFGHRTIYIYTIYIGIYTSIVLTRIWLETVLLWVLKTNIFEIKYVECCFTMFRMYLLYSVHTCNKYFPRKFFQGFSFGKKCYVQAHGCCF